MKETKKRGTVDQIKELKLKERDAGSNKRNKVTKSWIADQKKEMNLE